MKLVDGIQIMTVADSTVAVTTGEAAEKFRGIVRLNETATFIVQRLKDGKSVQDIAAELAEQYEISAEKAEADAKLVLAQLMERGLVE